MRWRPKYNPFVTHRWFAWRPVKTEGGTWVWLETIWRRGEDVWGFYWVYNLGDAK